MAIIDSKTGKVRVRYSIGKLKETANRMRGYCLTAISCAGSGHSGGSLSVMDVAAALYLSVLHHDPKDPNWKNRDRVVWSAGHKAPALYTALGMSGYFPIEETALLRKFGSKFQGHPHWLKVKGVEVSTGSLGQGLSLAVGMALAAKLNKQTHKIYTITGDGEWAEGSMWEAAMEAAHYNLDNLIVCIDRNYLQIDGNTETVMKLDWLNEKLTSFGFKVFKVNGHNLEEILTTFEKAKAVQGKPAAIVFRTIKGKGVSFMENVAGWHGKAPNDEELEKSLKELKLNKELNPIEFKEKARKFQEKATVLINKSVPKFKRDYWWNNGETMKVQMEPTRFGFGKTLAKRGGDKRVVCLGLDISDSIQISKFHEGFEDRKNRWLSMGIAEQSATTVAGGLAREGKLPVLGTYGVFCSQRNADQMRTSICYGNLNVMFGGAHGGVSVGADGATHQSLEEFSVVGILPNMNLAVPCDSIETERLTEYLLFKVKGPKYIRFAREATPILTTKKTPLVFGQANVIRFRGIKNNFIDAFETILGSKYKNEQEKVTLISCGPELAEAMRAAWILETEFKIKVRVINLHTLKPLDKKTIIKAGQETKLIVTAEEHQKGGLGNLVAGVIMTACLSKPVKMAMIGVEDKFGESGGSWELMKAFKLSAEFIAKKVITSLKE
ncbi:MAG: transketolase [Candidatus Beckwithbacteria bacterium]